MKNYKNNTSGRKGVYATLNGTWVAGIAVSGKWKHLGTHATKDSAIRAREQAEQHG